MVPKSAVITVNKAPKINPSTMVARILRPVTWTSSWMPTTGGATKAWVAISLPPKDPEGQVFEVHFGSEPWSRERAGSGLTLLRDVHVARNKCTLLLSSEIICSIWHKVLWCTVSILGRAYGGSKTGPRRSPIIPPPGDRVVQHTIHLGPTHNYLLSPAPARPNV